MGEAETDDRADTVRLIRLHGPRLQRLAYVLVGDWQDAEDIVLEAFTRTWAHRFRLRAPEAAGAYARRTVVRLAWRMKGSARSARVVVGTPAELPGGDGDSDRRLDLYRNLMDLPPDQRTAVALRFLEGLTETEAAALLGCPVGTVKSRTARGLERLRQLMVTEEEDA
ncbi:MAG: RNA polymerase sigma factor [Mycobacteriales bacterium]